MGFETVVRPVVFPNIRPPAARIVPIEDAPDKGLAVITGGSGSVVNWPYSGQSGWTTSRMVEVKRKYTKARLYYTRPDGTLDFDQYWEFEVLESVEYVINGQVSQTQIFAPVKDAKNFKVMERHLTRTNEKT